MKALDNIPHVTVNDLVACGFKREKIDNYTSLGYSTLPFIKIKGAKLFPFNTLGDKYKEAILQKFGDPMEYMLKAPIKDLVKYDTVADHYFTELTKRGQYSFSDEWILKNTWAASWLNMVLKIGNKDILKREFNMSVDTFLSNVCDLIKLENINLPSSQKRLRMNLKQYQQEGYDFFIHGSTGKTSNAAKINDELSEAYLLSLVEHHNQYDDVMVCFLYNIWAKEKGYKELDSPATVGNWRRKKEPEITIGRYGNNRLNEKYIRQVKGFKPTAPCMLWESDDNNLDFYFLNNDPKAESKEHNRYVAYIVTDSHCGLVLGKAYRLAKSPVTEMVRLAYIDAMYYVRKLTGGWHLPFEVKADHWQRASVFPFFERIGKFVPPAVANKHRGYIEPLFGSPHFKRCEKIGANNYNGNNVTAATSGTNFEALVLNTKDRPQIGNEAEHQIETMFHLLRHFPDMTRDNMAAGSKEQQWLNKWNTMTDDQKRPISDEQFLRIFGIKHEPQGRQITITNRGVEPQINGKKYSYDLPNYVDMMPLIGEKVNVIYDPYDMSRVLITNGKDIRFIASEATLQPRALQDTYANSRQMLNMILNEKKEQVNTVAAKAAKRKVLLENEFDSEAVVLAAFQPKELKNNVEHHYLTDNSNTPHETKYFAYLDAQRDWNNEDFDS